MIAALTISGSLSPRLLLAFLNYAESAIPGLVAAIRSGRAQKSRGTV